MRVSSTFEDLFAQACRFALNIEPSQAEFRARITANTEHYRRLQREIPKCAKGSFQHLALDCGLHTMQSLLYQTGGDTEAMRSKAEGHASSNLANAELLAALDSLAEINTQLSIALLPESLLELADEWGAAPVERQKEICESLFLFLRRFHARDRKESLPQNASNEELESAWTEDYYRQEPQRIFPRFFLREERFEPNCLGKAQMLLAFFERAGARTLGLTPIQISERSVHDTLGILGEAIFSYSEQRGITISEKLRQRFNKRQSAIERLNRSPCRFHMAIAVELADTTWFVIDPHMQVRGALHDSLELHYAARFVDAISQVHPGFCTLCGDGGGLQKATFMASMAAGKHIDLWQKIDSHWAQYGYDARAAIPLFVQSRAVDLFVSEGVGVFPEEKEELAKILSGDAFAIFTFSKGKGQEQMRVNFRSQDGSQVPLEDSMRLQVGMKVLTMLALREKADIERFDDPELHAQGLRRALEILPSLAYRDAAKTLGVTEEGGTLLHPIFEVYQPTFRVAVEQIAHLNALADGDNRVIMELASVCGGQHHLALAACEQLRTNSKASSALAWEAIDVLQHSLVRLPVADEALRVLEREQILFISPDKEEQRGQRQQEAAASEPQLQEA